MISLQQVTELLSALMVCMCRCEIFTGLEVPRLGTIWTRYRTLDEVKQHRDESKSYPKARDAAGAWIKGRKT
jgi:hypothetical protein